MMREALEFIRQALYYDFQDLVAGFCGIIVSFSAYHWVNYKLKSRIHSTFFRRNIIALTAMLLFFIYDLIWEHHSLSIPIILFLSSFLFFNLYYLISLKLQSSGNWVSIIKFLIMFFLFWVFMVSLNLIINSYEDMHRGHVQNLIGNFHLKYDERIYFLKREFAFSFIIAFLATSVDFGCKYIIGLQQLKQNKKEFENLKLKEQLTQAQLDVLHAKVNPHFLYNALNSIAGLALTDGNKTREMAVSLSRFFRYSINQEQKNLITIREEFAMVETYLEIEKVRFEDQINFKLDIQPGLEQNHIPRFILQPLVENSVKHGRKGDKPELFIEMTAYMENNKLTLSVHDNGLPFDENLGTGYGLTSLYEKLDLLFHGKYEVNIDNYPIKQIKILLEI